MTSKAVTEIDDAVRRLIRVPFGSGTVDRGFFLGHYGGATSKDDKRALAVIFALRRSGALRRGHRSSGCACGAHRAKQYAIDYPRLRRLATELGIA